MKVGTIRSLVSLARFFQHVILRCVACCLGLYLVALSFILGKS